MPPIDIRPAVSSDIPVLIQFSHTSENTHTWQMDSTLDQEQLEISFHKIRLPRSVKMDYPRNPEALVKTWMKRDLLLVSRIQVQRCGYLSLDLIENKIGRVIDLVVDEPFRRQGVASTLLIAAQDWLKKIGIFQMRLEMQIKNQAAISLADKLGFVFCGYMDQYFGNREIAVFYSLFLR